MAPLLVFALTLTIFLSASRLLHQTQQATAAGRAHSALEYDLKLLSNQMRTEKDLVVGAAAAIRSGMRVDQKHWPEYVATLTAGSQRPGSQGISVGFLMTSGGAAGNSTLTIRYIAPLDPINSRAVGFDLLSEQERREAVFAARDTGRPTITGKLRLVQQAIEGKSDPGFDVFAAIYAPDLPISTVEERRKAFRGIVCDAFLAPPLFKDLFDLSKNNVEVEIFASDRPSPASLIFSNTESSRDQILVTSLRFEAVPHSWILLFYRSIRFESSIVQGNMYVRLAVASSFLLSFTLGFLVWQLTSGRNRALAAALTASKSLQAEQSRFHSIVQGISDCGIITLDSQGRIVTFNTGAERLYGFRADEVIGTIPYQFYPPEGERTPESNCCDAAQTGCFKAEAIRLRKNGARFLAEINISPVNDSDGALTGFAVIVRDITEARAAEQRLARSEQQLRDAQELAGMGHWELDCVTGRGVASERAAILMGITSPDRSYSIADCIANLTDADRDRGTAAIAEAFSGFSQVCELQHQFRQADGRAVWVMGRARVQRDAEGCPVRAYGTIMDITDLKAVEEAKDAQARTEKRINRIVETIREVIFEIDSSYCWVFLNSAWTKFTGFEMHESLGKPADYWLAPAQHRRCARDFRRLIKGRIPVLRKEVLVRKKDGTYRWMEVIAEIADSGPDGERRIVGTLVDIHGRIESAQALEQARRVAEEGSLGKSRFLAIVSRELRLPLGALVGKSRVLCNAKLTHQERETALAVRQSAQELLGVLNSLVDLSRLEAGLMKLSPIPVDVRLATEDVIEAFALHADQRRLDLVLLCDPAIPKRVLTDPGRYRQLLSILVENALAYTSHGQVTVAVSLASTSQRGLELQVQVNDTGSGLIPAEALSSDGIANPSTQEGKRLGLGLALAKHLVTFLCGTGSVKGTPDVGSTVTFKIGCPRDPQAWPAPIPPTVLHNTRILVVEPSPAVHAGLRSALQGGHVQLVEAYDAPTALDILRQESGAGLFAILYSTEAPGSDWDEFGANIRRDSRFANVALILLTRSTSMPSQSDIARAGYARALRRNPSRQQLWAALEGSASGVFRSPESALASTLADHPPEESPAARVLLVTNTSCDVRRIEAVFKESGCDHLIARSVAEASSLAQRTAFNLVILDEALSAESLSDCARQLRISPSAGQSPFALLAAETTTLETSVDYLAPEDVLARDFTAPDLQALIRRLSGTGDRAASFDKTVALARCGDDWELLSELSQDFRDYAAILTAAIIKALSIRDLGAASDGVEKLRSSALFFGAGTLCQRLDEVTGLVNLHDWAAVPSAFSSARIELNRLCGELPRSSPAHALTEITAC